MFTLNFNTKSVMECVALFQVITIKFLPCEKFYFYVKIVVFYLDFYAGHENIIKSHIHISCDFDDKTPHGKKLYVHLLKKDYTIFMLKK